MLNVFRTLIRTRLHFHSFITKIRLIGYTKNYYTKKIVLNDNFIIKPEIINNPISSSTLKPMVTTS